MSDIDMISDFNTKTKELTLVPCGTAIFCFRDHKLLLLKRISEWGGGLWGLPGGKIHIGETSDISAVREFLEETGIHPGDIQRLGWNDYVETKDTGDLTTTTQWITLFYISRDAEGEPFIVEPEKCSEMKWFTMEDLPWNEMFGPLKYYLDQNKWLWVFDSAFHAPNLSLSGIGGSASSTVA